MIEQGVDEGAVEVAVAGMYHHAGRLVHHEHVVIFINYIERNVLRDQVDAAAAVRHDETDDIPRTDKEIGLSGLLPYLNIAFFDSTLDTMSRSIFEMGRHELVDANGHLPGIDVETEMLEHSLFFVLDFDYFVIVPVHLYWTLPSSVVSQSDTAAPMVSGPLETDGLCL